MQVLGRAVKWPGHNLPYYFKIQKTFPMDITIIALTVYGISAIVTQSKIFAPLRDLAEKHSPDFWYYLTSCMQCFPFWAGVFVSLVTEAPVRVSSELLPKWLDLFLSYLFSGALLSGTTMLIHTLYIYLLGDHWNQKQEKERLRKTKAGILKSDGSS